MANYDIEDIDEYRSELERERRAWFLYNCPFDTKCSECRKAENCQMKKYKTSGKY